MRKLCVFVGLAAIGYKLHVGAMFALWLSSGVAESINVLVGAAIAAWFVVGDRLGERIASPAWAVYGFGAAGAAIFLMKYFVIGSLWALIRFGLMGTTVITSVVDGLLMLCFLKLAADLMSKDEIAPVGEKT